MGPFLFLTKLTHKSLTTRTTQRIISLENIRSLEYDIGKKSLMIYFNNDKVEEFVSTTETNMAKKIFDDYLINIRKKHEVMEW